MHTNAFCNNMDRFKLNSHITNSFTKDSCYILNNKSGECFVLDEVAFIIYSYLIQENSIDNIALKICDIYEIDVNTAKRDIENLLCELEKKDIVKCANSEY